MISNSVRILKIAILLYGIISIQDITQAKAMPQAIHPATRQTTQPSDDATVDINPPSLL